MGKMVVMVAVTGKEAVLYNIAESIASRVSAPRVDLME